MFPQDSYLHTRIGILGTHLLTDADLPGLVERLDRETVLARACLDPQCLPADNLTWERRMLHCLLRDLNTILRPLTGKARGFFIFWARGFELFNLKTLIRGRLRHLASSEIEQHLREAPPFAGLSLPALLNTESIEELFRLLEDSIYADIARQARFALQERHDHLAAETAIDSRYFTGLFKRARALAPPHDRETVSLLGTQADTLNVAWLLRYRFNYHMGPSETYYHLIPHGRRLGPQRLLQLVELADINAVISRLPAQLRRPLSNKHSSMGIANALERLFLHEARRTLAFGDSVLARAYAYLLLRENELSRLRAILQGHSHGLDRDLMETAIGLPRATTDPARAMASAEQ